MKKTHALVIGVLAAFIIFSQSLAIAASEWQFDQAHSSFRFAIKHIYSTVHGSFDDYSGIVHFDPYNLAASKMHFEIAVKSIQTQINKRDKHLLSPDFFDAGQYPRIVFDSTEITHSGGNQYVATGKLTMKDVTQDIVLPFLYYGIKNHPAIPGTEVMGLDAAMSLNRLDYHVGDGKFYNMGIVDDTVVITVSLEMLRKK